MSMANNMPQSESTGIDQFNKNVIDNVIKGLTNDLSGNSNQFAVGSVGFGNEDGNDETHLDVRPIEE